MSNEMILTNNEGDKFYVNIDTVESIAPIKFRGGCEILLTSGRSVTCIEEFKSVVERFELAKA